MRRRDDTPDEMVDEPPQSFGELRLRIVECHPRLSRHLQAIAQFAIANPNAMAVEKVTELAAMIGVQPSSLVRFAQAMGFSGMSAMRRLFKVQLLRDVAQERLRADAVSGLASVPEGDVLDQLIGEALSDLDLLRRTIPPDRLDTAAGLILQADEIYVVAQQLSFGIAHYVACALLQIGRQCHLLDNVGGIALRQSELATGRDVTIAISFQPYSPSVVQAAQAHAARGGAVIALTDTALSPLAPPARVVLEAPQRRPHPMRAMAAPVCLAEALIGSVRRRLAAQGGCAALDTNGLG
jgi:DNA-binding MurR/RpiR family transcriptional regulator